MMRLPGLFLLIAAGCSAPPAPPVAAPPPPLMVSTVADDGSYLEAIDPLGGQWSLERIGDQDFTRHAAWINFSAGGFLNHGAGCSGGYPAFYRLDGDRLTVTRREAVRIGKCGSATSDPAAAADSERRLTAFLDQVVGWARPDRHSLVLTASDGARATLSRPREPHPDLAGRWRIESIGGEPFVTERRPATLSIAQNGIGAHGDCNSMGGGFTVPAPDRIVVEGPFVSTAIGCAPEDAAEDARMSQAMIAAKAYRLSGNQLVLTGGPGMVLRRPPTPDRRLAGEYQACGNTLLRGYHVGPVTLVIDRDTMVDNAGCTAAYSADGPRLTVRARAHSACAPPSPPFTPGEPISIGGEISPLAVAPPDGFGFDAEGRLVLRTASGLLTMCRKGSPPPFGG